MAEFDRPIESSPDSSERALLLTQVWVDDVPVSVKAAMDVALSRPPGARGIGSGAGRRRRKKLRFPSRLTF